MKVELCKMYSEDIDGSVKFKRTLDNGVNVEYTLFKEPTRWEIVNRIPKISFMYLSQN